MASILRDDRSELALGMISLPQNLPRIYYRGSKVKMSLVDIKAPHSLAMEAEGLKLVALESSTVPEAATMRSRVGERVLWMTQMLEG